MATNGIAVGSAALMPHHAGNNPHRSVAKTALCEAGSITESIRARTSRPLRLQLQHSPYGAHADLRSERPLCYAFFSFVAPYGKFAVPASSALNVWNLATLFIASSGLSAPNSPELTLNVNVTKSCPWFGKRMPPFDQCRNVSSQTTRFPGNGTRTPS